MDYEQDLNKEDFKSVILGIDQMQSIEKLVEIESITVNADYKRQAGASNLLKTCSSIRITKRIGFIKTDCDIRMLGFKYVKLIFLPNIIVCYHNRNWYLINYKDFGVSYSNTRFIELGSVPKDTQIIDSSWKFTNKDGSPDLRFNNNFKIPICAYAEVEIKSLNGLRILIMGSNRDAMNSFNDKINNYIKRFNNWAFVFFYKNYKL